MIVEYNRIVLRPFEPRDAKELFKITNDPAVKRFAENAYCFSEQDALDNIVQYYEKGDFIHDYYFVITQGSTTGKMVGALIVTQNCEKEFEVCNIVGKEHRGKGIIRNAIMALINCMPKGSKLVFMVNKENQASINSLSFLKMQVEETEAENTIKYVYIV